MIGSRLRLLLRNLFLNLSQLLHLAKLIQSIKRVSLMKSNIHRTGSTICKKKRLKAQRLTLLLILNRISSLTRLATSQKAVAME